MIKKIVVRLLLFSLFLLVVAGTGGGFWLYQQVVKNPGEEIKLAYIQGILGKESHVFYRDGKTPLGVFFDTAHRQYISFEEIPENFVKALVASEDSRFFDHYGFDLQSIVRASIKNIKAGRVVQGGSTLTQQTAKNLFKRKDRSFTAKFKELLMALKLEYYYSKEQIFEFYANQFYVSGNGVGLGVAARYYFDKTPAELSLVECAFIAGSVNRPNYYNPFRKKTAKGRELAIERAQVRLGYVLKEMRELGMIDVKTYEKANNTPIAFKQGKVGYAFDYVMEMVKEAVSSDEVLAALARHNIENIATSGVRIVTNIDQLLQRKTLAALRYRLGVTDVVLRGYTRAEVQKELAAAELKTGSIAVEDAFFFGTIRGILQRKGDVRIDVELDGKAGAGYITTKGLKEIVSAWVKHRRKDRYAEPGKGDVAAFIKELQLGDRIWAQVVSIPQPETEEQRRENSSDAPLPVELRLARYPQLQGGAVVVQQGKIRAVAGGTENRFFNRAMDAKRTMGSAFKPLVYAAAIQLGWNSADLLYNARAPYDYQRQIYFPRPDHHNPNAWVSMNWAGVRSENLATIWLLSKLCDKLTPLQFKEVAQRVGLAPRRQGKKEESYQNYSKRLRDKAGILMSASRLQEAAYHMALASLEADFIFDGLEKQFANLSNLPYGARFPRYEEEIEAELKAEKSPRKQNELRERKKMLQKSFLKLEEIYPLFLKAKEEVVAALDSTFFWEPQPAVFVPVYKNLADGTFHFLPSLRSDEELPGMIPFSGSALIDYLQDMDEAARRRFWEDIHLGGVVSARAFLLVQNQAKKEYARLLGRRPYEFDILQHVEDFRIAVGLHYMVQFCQKMGITSALEPVLSFPLGSNVVTPFELTRAYESLVTGELTTFGGSEELSGNADDRGDLLAVIDHIESADGELLYMPEAVTSPVVDQKSRLEINSILENVVRFGTGRYAHQNVRFHPVEAGGKEINSFVTLLGKTGTANNYTNSSFFGFVPVADGSGTAMTLDSGYAVGVYCGYDDNRPMKRGRVHISGSNGALPIWTDIARTIIDRQQLVVPFWHVSGEPLSYFLEEESLIDEIYLQVDRQEGGIPLWRANQDVAGIRTLGRINRTGFFIPERHFAPFWSDGSGAEK